jgi:hypothetical protein
MQDRQILAPELKILATSPVFRPKIKRQRNKMRSQMVSLGMAFSWAVFMFLFAHLSRNFQ